MDITLSEGLIRWNCPEGHTLGVVIRVRVKRGHVSRLMLFRQAIGADCAAEVDVIAVVEGTTLEIRCSICGAMRPWYIGQDAMDRLMERVRASSPALAPLRPSSPTLPPISDSNQ